MSVLAQAADRPEEHACSDMKAKSKNHKGRRQMDDDFMMRLYKIKLCTRTTPHNWKLCPWAHPGETAALRRDPATHMAEMCPAVRQHQECPHGEGCLYARNTFECWLHPYRYRTTMCSSGEACTRNICFFAHNEQELRTPPDVTQQWAMQGTVPGMDTLLLLDMTPAQAQQLLGSSAGVAGAATASGPLAGLMTGHASTGACGLSPAASFSSPMPVVSMAAPWCSMVSPGTSTPIVTISPHAQQLQMQQALIQQQQQLQAGGFISPQAVSASLPRPGVMSVPVCAGMDAGTPQAAAMVSAGSSSVLYGMGQQEMVLPGQHAKYSPVASAYNIGATAGMYPEGAQASSGLISLSSVGPSPANSAVKLPGLQPSAADQHALQQAAAMQQAAMLLQQLQLSGAAGPASSRLSTDSLHSSLQSSLMQGSGSSSRSLPALSQLSLPDLGSDTTLASLISSGYPITQDLSGRRNSGALLSAVGVPQDASLPPLESCGLIQMSAIDEGPVMVDPCQQPVTMAMQQPGRFW